MSRELTLLDAVVRKLPPSEVKGNEIRWMKPGGIPLVRFQQMGSGYFVSFGNGPFLLIEDTLAEILPVWDVAVAKAHNKGIQMVRDFLAIPE